MTIPLRSDNCTNSKRIATLRVAASLPANSRVARGQAEWLRAVETHPSVAELRGDARANVLALAWVLVRSASWTDMTTRPTWLAMMQRTGLARRTVARRLAGLREFGLLGLVESGTTPQYRPMALRGAGGNRAAVYVLAVPSSAQAAQGTTSGPEVRTETRAELSTRESGTPTWSIPEGVDPNARARLGTEERGPLRGPDCAEDGQKWPRTRAAGSRRDRLELVRRLQSEAPDLARLTDRALRHLLRPWLLAGWTVSELLWALDHEPDGTARTWTTGVRSPGGWLLARLQAWTVTPGVACSPPSVALRASESANMATIEAFRAEVAAAAAERDASVEFGRRVELVAGALYPVLLEVVAAREFAGNALRRMFAAAVPRLARAAVRSAVCEHCRPDTTDDTSCRAAEVSDVDLATAVAAVIAGTTPGVH